MPLEIRMLRDDEFVTYSEAISRGFGGVYRPEESHQALKTFEFDRSIVVFDGNNIVGTAGAVTKTMTVPGGTQIPTAAITDVTVQPTHRRRGILTKIIDHQLKDIRDRGESLAALWASEGIIYGRFGYGVGIECEHWTISREMNAYNSSVSTSGSVTFATPNRLRQVAPEIWERVREVRPGMMSRSENRWDSWIRDPEHERRGATARLSVLYEQLDQVEGYATYRISRDSPPPFEPRGKLIIDEMLATTDDAHAALWRFCLDVDLIDNVESWNRPPDDPLKWRLANPRELRRIRRDALWIRVIDVTHALEARRYNLSGQIVIQLNDNFCPWNQGRYILDFHPDGATCKPTNKSADIELDEVALASIYMGGARLSTLASAGRAREFTSGSVLRSDAIFSSNPMPWCPEQF